MMDVCASVKDITIADRYINQPENNIFAK